MRPAVIVHMTGEISDAGVLQDREVACGSVPLVDMLPYNILTEITMTPL